MGDRRDACQGASTLGANLAFDPKQAGLSDTPKESGTWVMYAGTPYAHLMINQQP